MDPPGQLPEGVQEEGLTAVPVMRAVVPGLDDGAVVGEPIEHGRYYLWITKHGRSLTKRQIEGDDRGALVEFANEVEQQLAARAGGRQVAELVEPDNFEPR